MREDGGWCGGVVVGSRARDVVQEDGGWCGGGRSMEVR